MIRKVASWEVSVPADQALECPRRCAVCGTVASPAWTRVPVVVDLAFYQCASCRRLVKAWPRTHVLFALLSILIVSGIGLIAYADAHIASPFAVWVVPTVLALLLIGNLAWLIFLRPTAFRRERRRSGAVVFDRRRGSLRTFFCRSNDWARDFSNLNRGSIREVRERDIAYGAVFGVVFALVVTPILSAIAWNQNFVSLYVDNAADTELKVWLDGEVAATVMPNHDGHHSRELRVFRGPHVVGLSLPRADRPTREFDTEMVRDHDYLFNPGSLACYWRSVALYDDTETKGVAEEDGPLPIQDFYDFSHVDYFFEPPPTFISSSNRHRTAILRNVACTEMAKRHCEPVRTSLIACEYLATSEADVDQCIAKARIACATPVTTASVTTASITPNED